MSLLLNTATVSPTRQELPREMVYVSDRTAVIVDGVYVNMQLYLWGVFGVG